MGEVHAGLLKTATPLSWFIVRHIPGAESHLRGRLSDGTELRQGIELHKESDDLVSMIVRGDEEVVEIISEKLAERRWAWRLLPAATLTITISAGEPADRDRPRWDRVD
ncbi:hypothetical protein EXN71_03980 [Rhizobium rhizogenes]|nr:hypothetical protein EXN73_03980 [Rhizobium rhizogenes]TRB63562.1 hypothetical protein EXN71_03980 [Rhizobium rhizogenes]